MGNFRVLNVKGDGSCLYRCLWRVACEDEAVAKALWVDHCLDCGEDACVWILRRHVAELIRAGHRRTLANLVSLASADPEVLEMYPVLEDIDLDGDLGTIMDVVCSRISRSHVYASELEVEAVRKRLRTTVGTGLVVLTCPWDVRDRDALTERWLSELLKALAVVRQPRVAVLNNVGNAHYRYARFAGDLVCETETMRAVLESLAESSDSDSDSDSD